MTSTTTSTSTSKSQFADLPYGTPVIAVSRVNSINRRQTRRNSEEVTAIVAVAASSLPAGCIIRYIVRITSRKKPVINARKYHHTTYVAAGTPVCR